MKVMPISSNKHNARINFGTKLDKSLKRIIESGVERNIIGEKELQNLIAIKNNGLEGKIWLETAWNRGWNSTPGSGEYDKLIFENPTMLKLRKKFKKTQGTRVFAINNDDKFEDFVVDGKILYWWDKISDHKKFVEIMTPENILKAYEKSEYLERYYEEYFANKEESDKRIKECIEDLLD